MTEQGMVYIGEYLPYQQPTQIFAPQQIMQIMANLLVIVMMVLFIISQIQKLRRGEEIPSPFLPSK